MVPEERPLDAQDIEGCLRLVAEAGWNQTENDWLTIFEIGEARGLFRQDQLIATAAIVRHGPIGWICMVLVKTTEQRQGLATHLLNWAVQRLEEIGLTAGLDATPAGREVYLKLSFEDVYGVTRLQCEKPQAIQLKFSGPAPRSIGQAHLAAISQFDRRAFGAERGALLASLIERRPDLALATFEGAECTGFTLAREGRKATQIGPVVARDNATALDLLQKVLTKVDGPVFLDLLDRHVEARRWLEDHGFSEQRPFTRMLRGRREPFDDSGLVFALTGPEFA
jgi:GNAT superfamily N-acetyltransferase